MAMLEFTEEITTRRTHKWKLHHCDTCKLFKTTSMFFMSNHAKRHEMGLHFFSCEISNVEMYFCKDCNIRSDMALVLKQHLLQFHVDQTEIASQVPKEGHKYDCSSCKFQTYSVLIWFKHITEGSSCKTRIQDQHEMNKPSNLTEFFNQLYKCDKCSFKTRHKTSLKKHAINRHLEDHEIRWHTCDKCEFKCKTGFSLRRHKISKHLKDHEIPWYMCDKCKFKTKDKRNLINHKVFKHFEDHEIQWYKCDKCLFKSKDKRGLSSHKIFKHLEDHEISWYTCDECEFRTKGKYSLNSHKIRKHLEDHEIQWYECDKCEFRTKSKYNLRSHKMSQHLGDHEIHWYRCNKCEFKTKGKRYLGKHKLLKHLESLNSVAT